MDGWMAVRGVGLFVMLWWVDDEDLFFIFIFILFLCRVHTDRIKFILIE